MYCIASLGNEYWASYQYCKTIQEAETIYNKEVDLAKTCTSTYGPITIYIQDTNLNKIIRKEVV